MSTKEFITHEVNDTDAWICKCGNIPVQNGFFPCDATGKEIEPINSAWKNLYVCAECGRIISQDTLEIVGQTLLFRR